MLAGWQQPAARRAAAAATGPPMKADCTAHHPPAMAPRWQPASCRGWRAGAGVRRKQRRPAARSQRPQGARARARTHTPALSHKARRCGGGAPPADAVVGTGRRALSRLGHAFAPSAHLRQSRRLRVYRRPSTLLRTPQTASALRLAALTRQSSSGPARWGRTIRQRQQGRASNAGAHPVPLVLAPCPLRSLPCVMAVAHTHTAHPTRRRAS